MQSRLTDSPSPAVAAEPVAWQPIETAPEWLRSFAKECEALPDRNGFVEFGGTMEDGRGFLLLRKDSWEKAFDRWLKLPPFSLLASPTVRGDREAVARIIDPALFEKYDLEFASGRCAQNGRNWAEVCYRESIDATLAKAAAILSLPVQPGAGERTHALLKQLAFYYDVNDCHERDGDNALEVPIRDLKEASEIFAILSRQAPHSSSETES